MITCSQCIKGTSLINTLVCVCVITGIHIMKGIIIKSHFTPCEPSQYPLSYSSLSFHESLFKAQYKSNNSIVQQTAVFKISLINMPLSFCELSHVSITTMNEGFGYKIISYTTKIITDRGFLWLIWVLSVCWLGFEIRRKLLIRGNYKQVNIAL